MLVKRFHFSEVHLRGSLPFSYKCFQKALSGACLCSWKGGLVASKKESESHLYLIET